MKKLNGASVIIMLTAVMLIRIFGIPRIFGIYISANRVNVLWLKIFICQQILTALQSAECLHRMFTLTINIKTYFRITVHISSWHV